MNDDAAACQLSVTFLLLATRPGLCGTTDAPGTAGDPLDDQLPSPSPNRIHASQ